MGLRALVEKRAHGMLPWSGAVNLAAAAALFVAITVLTGMIDDPRTGVGFLYLVPALLLTLQYGLRGAVGGVALAFVLLSAWELITPRDVSLFGASIRVLVIAGPPLLVVAGERSRELTRKELSETGALLRAIADKLPDALYVLDEEGRYGLVNAAAAELVGRKPDELLGTSYVESLPAATATDLTARRLEIEQEPDSSGRIDRIRFEDGEHVFRSVTGPVKLPGRDARGIFVLSQDITSEHRRNTWMQVQHRITEGLVKRPPIEELPAMILDQICHVEDVEWGAYWHRGRHGSYRCLAVDGEAPPFTPGELRELSDMPHGFHVRWRDPRGDRRGPTALVPVTEDGVAMVAYRGKVPDQDTIEQIFRPAMLMVAAYVERTKLAAEAERTKNDFFGLISHELRTPLTSIIGYSELLSELEGDALSEQAQKFVEVITRNAHRELRLVQDLLLLVRLDAGTFSLESEAVDLNAIVAQSCEAVRPQAERAGVELRLSLDETGEVWADSHRIGQAVDNLLTNAIKFSERGDSVRVALEARPDGFALEVEDEGIGVAADEVDKLFDRLFRATSAVSNQVQGTGLGLTIVKSVVEAHGGTISVRSEEGEGTCFRLELPRLARPQADAASETAPETAGAAQ